MHHLSRKTKVLILGALFILSIISIVILVSLTTQPKPSTTTGGLLPTPNIPNYSKADLTITLTLKETAFHFPVQLPLLNRQSLPRLTDSQINIIARGLGFSTDPIKNQDAINGPVLTWNNTTNFLIIAPQINKIKFGPSRNPNTTIQNTLDKHLSDQDLQTIAADFLKNKITVSENSLKFAGFKYLAPKKGLELFKITTKGQAKIIQVNYSLANTDYPVLTLDPNATLIYVQLLIDGTVLNSEINFTGNFAPGVTPYTLLTYNQLVEAVNKATLVSLNDGNINLSDLTKESLGQLSINEVELGYLYDASTSLTLQPIFILKGSTQVAGYSHQLSAVLYLPAIATP